jgi:predicted ribosomally synthesized peptide with SipW-like signal peptide
MLLGTTFAWFTDSVTSANNVITAGNLDVNLHYWDNSMANGTFVAIEDEPDLKLLKNADGEEILWEPGASGFGKFKVANEGTLALKYRLVLAFYNATETAEGKTLADVLSVYALVRDAEKGDDGKMEDANLNKLVTENMDSYVPDTRHNPLRILSLKDISFPANHSRMNWVCSGNPAM